MIFLFSLALILLIYLSVLHSPPTYDDVQYFLEPDKAEWNWKWLRSWYNRAFSRATLTATFAFVRPGWQLPVFHTTHSLLHAVNAVLVYAIAAEWVEPVSASIAALVFAVSPLATAAVCRIATRSMLLAGPFYLGATLLTLAGWPLAALVLVVPAMYAREDSVTLIPLIAVLAPESAAVVVGIPLLLASQRVEEIRYVIRHKIAKNGSEGMKMAGMTEILPQPDYSITAVAENSWRWPLWNVGLLQNPDPNIQAVDRGGLKVIGAGFAMVAGLAAAWFLPEWRLPVLLILVSPWVASWAFPMPDVVAEARAYLTIPGFALAASRLPLSIPVWTGVITFLAVIAAWRAFPHRHPVPYWRSAWRERHPKLRVAVNIGVAYQNVTDMPNAILWHRKALEIASTSGVAFANIGLWEEGMAKLARAEVASDLVLMGYMDQAKAQGCNARSMAHLTNALSLMSQGLTYCPEDQMVRKMAEQVRVHAQGVGIPC